MQTMHPVVMVGVNERDPALLPRDEFDARRRRLQAVAAENGWDGVVVHGDCERNGLVTWLSNFHPLSRWELALVPAEGKATLLIAGGTRDLPAAAETTWVEDVRSYNDVRTILPEWLSWLGKASGRPRIGCYGFGHMRPPVAETVAKALDAADCHDADRALAPLLREKRPRDVAMIRQAAEVVTRALDSLRNAHGRGASVAEAALATERTARLLPVHDVRLLVSFDNGRTLEPFFQMKEGGGAPLIVYLAVRHTGYWAESFVTLGGAGRAPQAATKAVESMAAGIRPGMSGRDLSTLAAPALGGLKPHPVLGGRIGYAIGHNLDDDPIDANNGEPAIADHGVYALRAGCLDDGAAIASAIVHVRSGRCECLLGPA